MKTTFKKPLIIALALVLLFTGCSKNKSDNRNSRSGNNTIKAADSQLSDTSQSYDSSMGYAEGLEYNGYSDYEEAAPEVYRDNKPAESNIPEGAMLIRTMNITADTADFPGLTSLVDAAVKNNGGYYESMNVTGTGKDNDFRRGYYVIRVPANCLDSLVSSLEGNVTITNRSENTEDVTLSYVDMESRLASLRIEMDNLLEMLEDANEIETIVYLQSEISDVRYQIESYESQIRVMENKVNFSTLYLTLNEVIEEKEEEPIEVKREKTLGDEIKETWSETVANMKENAKDLLLWTVSALPGIILSCIIILIIVVIVIVRKKRNHKKLQNLNAKQDAPESKKE